MSDDPAGSDVPELRFTHLQFDEFHPLWHAWGGRECRAAPGGPRRHLALAWEFVAEPGLRRWLTCVVGRHRPVTWTRLAAPGSRDVAERFVACRDCARRLPSEDAP